MLSCQQLIELVTDYLEERLSLRERLSFGMHILMCKHCRAYLEQMRQTIDLLGHLPCEEIPDEARDELLQRFRNWRRDASP